MENVKIEGNIWVETSSGVKIGKGRAQLLEQIEKTGSIAEAARITQIPYRKAWGMIKDMNALVIKSSGGKNGGGTILTEEGKKLLLKFNEITQSFNLFKKGNS